MPKIFEYLGIVIRFYSNEHNPIHVHAQYGSNAELKIEFILEDHRIVEVRYLRVKGRDDFPPAMRRELETFLDEFKYLIVEEWINFFVYHTKPNLRKITKRL